MANREPRSLKDSFSGKVAEEIRVVLTRRQITQRQLADGLGMSLASLSYRLTATQELSLNEVQAIADFLEIDVLDLMPAREPVVGAA